MRLIWIQKTFHTLLRHKSLKLIKRIYFVFHVIIDLSQVEIRGSNIDQAKEFLKKVANCKSQILSDNQVFYLSTIGKYKIKLTY